MKRYLVFAGDHEHYDSIGGWEDFVGAYESLKDAQVAADRSDKDWWQIVDTTTMSEIERGD